MSDLDRIIEVVQQDPESPATFLDTTGLAASITNILTWQAFHFIGVKKAVNGWVNTTMGRQSEEVTWR